MAADLDRSARTASKADRALQRRRVEEITEDLPALPDFSEFAPAFRPDGASSFGDMRAAFYANPTASTCCSARPDDGLPKAAPWCPPRSCRRCKSLARLQTRDIMRAPGLGPGSGKPLAAERLAFDHRADLVAVDVEVADPGMCLDIVTDRIDAAVQAEGQAIAGRVDRLDDLVELVVGKRTTWRIAPKFSWFNWLSDLIS